MSFEDFEYEDKTRSKLMYELQEAKKLLIDAVNFMNLVPNRKYGDNYSICSKIGKFLKE